MGDIWLYLQFVLSTILICTDARYEKCEESLGMEDGKIDDKAISASSSLSSIKLPHFARLNKESAWTSSSTDINQYLQVEIGSNLQITSIATQGRQSTEDFVSQYYILYSDDMKEWTYYKNDIGSPKIFKGNLNADTTVRNWFNPPIIAKYIRIRPQKWNGYISMRIELYGCSYTSYVVSFDGNGDLLRYNLTHEPMQSARDVFRLRFQTRNADGILMHSLGSQGDMVLLTLQRASLHLYISLGLNPESAMGSEAAQMVSLRAGSLLDDNHWHEVSIERQGQHLMLMVDQIKSYLKISTNFHLLNLDTALTFGGSSSYDTLPALLTYKNFAGCMDNVIVNGINFVYEARSKAPGFEFVGRPGDTCAVKKTPTLTFVTPESYFTWPALEAMSAMNISLEFRTFHKDGLIALHHFAGGSGYVAVVLADGKVQVRLNLESQKNYQQIIDPFSEKFNDGLWHRVTTYIKSNEIRLDIDWYPSATYKHLDIRTGKKYEIGGGTTLDAYPGFLGCMRSLYLDSRMIPIASLKKGIDYTDGILVDSCSIIDRCTPNPCEHGGVCSQDWFSFQCFCDGTGYTGAICHTSIYPLSCEAYALRRHLYAGLASTIQKNIDDRLDDTMLSVSSGTRMTIDMDGSGPYPPLDVICEYYEDESDDKQTRTLLLHHQMDRTVVTGYSAPGSYKQRIHYLGLENDPSLLELFVNRSTACRQNVKFECLKARLMNSPNWNNKPMTWWVSRNYQPMYYWGGAPAGSGKCGCGVKETCIEPGKFCNCDSYQPYLLEDSGFLTEKEHLPVTEIAIGDTGSIEEDRKAYYTIGPLICSGNTLFDNAVTFRQKKAILIFPPIAITSSGDLQFEFKTSTPNAVLFENLGTDASRHYLRMKLLEGNKIQLEFSSGDGTRALTTQATDSLNNNQWHVVGVEWNCKEVRLSIDSYKASMIAEDEANFRDLKLTRKLVIGARADMTDGFVGCLRVFMINGALLDLRGLAQAKGNRGILEGCVGVCRTGDNFPCLNNGTCYEMWSHAKCDCAWTAFRGPYCTDDVGAHLRSETMLTYDFPTELGMITTIGEHLRVAFSTLEFQGILLEVTAYSGDFISLQIQNNGGLKIRFNFGYEPQEINDDRQVYANGQFHQVHVWRRDGGSTIILQVDDYEPMEKRYETGLSQDTKFNNLKRIYIGRNETTAIGKGFVGCIARVVFEDYFPLKEIFGDPQPPYVRVSPEGTSIVEDMCNVIPITPEGMDELAEPRESVISSTILTFGPETPRYRGIKIAILMAVLIILSLVLMFMLYLIAKFYTRHKGDYLTHEDDGAKDAVDADMAIIKGHIGQLDTIKKEWFF